MGEQTQKNTRHACTPSPPRRLPITCSPAVRAASSAIARAYTRSTCAMAGEARGAVVGAARRRRRGGWPLPTGGAQGRPTGGRAEPAGARRTVVERGWMGVCGRVRGEAEQSGAFNGRGVFFFWRNEKKRASVRPPRPAEAQRSFCVRLRPTPASTRPSSARTHHGLWCVAISALVCTAARAQHARTHARSQTAPPFRFSHATMPFLPHHSRPPAHHAHPPHRPDRPGRVPAGRPAWACGRRSVSLRAHAWGRGCWGGHTSAAGAGQPIFCHFAHAAFTLSPSLQQRRTSGRGRLCERLHSGRRRLWGAGLPVCAPGEREREKTNDVAAPCYFFFFSPTSSKKPLPLSPLQISAALLSEDNSLKLPRFLEDDERTPEETKQVRKKDGERETEERGGFGRLSPRPCLRLTHPPSHLTPSNYRTSPTRSPSSTRPSMTCPPSCGPRTWRRRRGWRRGWRHEERERGRGVCIQEKNDTNTKMTACRPLLIPGDEDDGFGERRKRHTLCFRCVFLRALQNSLSLQANPPSHLLSLHSTFSSSPPPPPPFPPTTSTSSSYSWSHPAYASHMK